MSKVQCSQVRFIVAAFVALTLGATAFAAPHRLKSDEERLSIIRPEADGSLRLEPTFVCCGLEFGAKKAIPGLKVEYRNVGSKCQGWNAVDGKYAVHSPRTMDYRLSLRDLDEDTEYEVRLVDGAGKVVKDGRFRTWESDVPIARTVLLDASGPLPKTVSAAGSPDGWIRYTAAAGTVLDFGEGSEDCVNVTGAKYVLFDDIVVKGTFGRRVFNVTDSSHVRFRNCNISRWGRVGKPRFDMKGRIFDPSKEAKGYGINFDGAIEIGRGCYGVVVERCYIHDPRGRANSWFYSHPAGPEAVVMAKPNGATVLRWNDFVGSDWHRFNDAVESAGNFDEDGGFNRDADVYGNFMAMCNDDCIEMDGAQRNVRNFDNRYESALCGVSVQGCMAGPSYCYRNAFYGMCDEFGSSGQTVKTGGGLHGPDARLYLEDNLFWGDGVGVIMMSTLNSLCARNRFCGKQTIHKKDCSPGSSYQDNQEGLSIAEGDLDPSVPVRPLPFVLDRARYSGFRVKGGMASPAAITVTAKGGDAASRFRIVKNDVFDWIDVTPSEGVIPANGSVELCVRVDAKRMKDRRNYRGAFQVTAPNGLSRPFSIYAETDFVPPYRAEKAGEFALYLPDGGKEGEYRSLTSKTMREFPFEVPHDGVYYLMIHGMGSSRLMVSVDGAEPEPSRQQVADGYPVWTMVAPGRKFGDMSCPFRFKAGRHTLKMSAKWGEFRYDGIVLTDSPGSFEPR